MDERRTTGAPVSPRYLSLDMAADYVAEQMGHRPSRRTIWGWIAQGIATRSGGDRIRLEHVRIGRRMRTRTEWIDAFLAALNPRREHRDTRAQLEEAGLI